MLPASGVTTTGPFTHPSLAKPALYETLHKMILRAYARVRPEDLARVRALLPATGHESAVRPPLVPLDFTSAQIGAVLESLIAVFATAAPYVMQPGNRRNRPPAGPRDQVLTALITSAQQVLDPVAAGAADATIRQVFGLPDDIHLPAIRQTFADASAGLPRLHANGAILIDERGELTIQGAAALSSPSKMLFPAAFFDAHTDDGVRTLLHECFHVASSAIRDQVYFGNASFDSITLSEKLANADHYGQVTRMRANLNVAPPGPITVQAGVGVALCPNDTTKVREAAAEASRRVTRAWVRTLWTWQHLGAVRAQQETWTVFSTEPDELIAHQLMSDSKTCGMTLHQGAGGRSIATPPASLPFPMVTDFDQAVMEEIIKDTHDLVSWSQRARTVDVLAAAPGGPGPFLLAADVRGQPPTGMADALVAQATASLNSPWLATPAALKTLVDSLRVRDSSDAAQ